MQEKELTCTATANVMSLSQKRVQNLQKRFPVIKSRSMNSSLIVNKSEVTLADFAACKRVLITNSDNLQNELCELWFFRKRPVSNNVVHNKEVIQGKRT